MPTLVLVRHGQSIWNLQNRFTGWVDVPLSEQGVQEARQAGQLLAGMSFDVAYTSALTRAQHTLALIQEGMAITIPVIRDEALNERHYGDLQGLNKADTAAKYGDAQVHIWRRSFDVPPPNGEALKQTSERTIPFYDRCIFGDLKQGRNVLVVAHGNSNRSIVMALEKLTGEEIMQVELATGIPIVYELDLSGEILAKRILESP
ncbi:MAG: 2,3-diphosphoglycerate-dependent phosphoglycerate mutase [Chthonomonas sp.]|nr:2,3-diphosphoglycerate-dependent phosphoglycerate mutase [Chthonomonas sp.]